MMKELNNMIPLLFLAAFSCCSLLPKDEIDYAFEYREIYLPERNTSIADALCLNNIDNDWALWGHHLSAVLPVKHSQTVYATVDNILSRDQFCFSSARLYDYIVEYIEDNYGESQTSRFAILPNDNNLVCMCPECRNLGNTANDASPAVFYMIKRLAERFPAHRFFTSYYRSTRSTPSEKLPDNVGVLISTMRYHISPVETSREIEFKDLLHSWSDKTNLVYVWDYINNFDDYFTPYPVFTIMQRRIRLYRDAGVKGLFLNGSGLDYSSFSDVKTRVLAALMQDPDVDWRKVLQDVCHQLYPTTGDVVAHFLTAQEDYVLSQARVLPIYDGVNTSLSTYLPKELFVNFFDSLQHMLPNTRSSEHTLVERQCKALALTRLEIMRIDGDVSRSKPLLDSFASLIDDGIDVYSESCWTIKNYVSDYSYMYRHAESMKAKNLLRGVELTPLTPLDEDYSDISVLTDGLLGLPSNYHCGNMLSSADPALKISIPYQDGMQHLRVCLVHNSLYHILLPSKVSMNIGGNDVASVVPKLLREHQGHAFAEFDIPANARGPIVLTLFRDTDDRCMAIDEIEGY